jgi:hypothetical protein
MSFAALLDTDEFDAHIISPEEVGALFDRLARKLLGISGAEFQRRWRAGESSDPAWAARMVICGQGEP